MMSELPTSDRTLRQVEIIHTSLAGLSLICMVLLAGLLLPVFGFSHVRSLPVAALICVIVCVGVGYLYFMNYCAHKIVLEQARLTDVLTNSLGQGFLTFDAKGICGSAYSQACCTLLECEKIPGKKIADLLNVSQEGRADFDEWLSILYMPDHALSFEDAARFMPDQLLHDNGRVVHLAYRPVRDKQKRLVCIVMIATDKTEEKDAQKRVDTERQFVAMVCAIFAEKQSFMLTMTEMKEMVERLTRIDATLFSPEFFRDVHTLKGAAMHFKMEVMGEKLHGLENTLRQLQSTVAEIGINSEAHEALSQHRAEVQLEFGRIQNSLRAVLGNENDRVQGIIEVDEDSLYDFGKLLKQHNVSPDVYYAYQNNLLSVPLFTLLKSLDRQMLPLAEKLEKKVKPIIFRGEEVRLPAKPLQHWLMALTHVVHNIVDHGIEAPITRMAKGKDPQGQVTIDVKKVTGDDGRKWVEIVISDDGAGIDPNRVRQKLMTADPEGSWRFDDDEHIIQQLLTHEVSTRDEISMLSGRGAGMSAVYQEVLHLKGQAVLRSEMHKGTRLIMRLPESLLTEFK
ncbi:MAG: ATP-binding protein [Alphaproteobacteria bacterium]|nr:ATP-binding protein [Alphaproteobacteria bacterium]